MLADQELREIVRDRVAADAFAQHFGFAVLDREHHQGTLAIAFATVVAGAAADVEEVLLVAGEARVVVGRHGHARDALRETLEVDLDRFFLRRVLRGCIGLVVLLVALFLLFLLGLVLFRIVLRAVRLVTRRFGLGFLDRDLVALRRKWMLDVLAQRHREQARRAIDREVPFEARELRRVFAIAQVVQVLAFGIPNGLGFVEHLVGDTLQLFVGDAPDVERAETVLVLQAEREPAAVGSPSVVAAVAALVARDLRHLLRVERERMDAAFLVAEHQVLAVGRPHDSVLARLAAARQLLELARAVLVGEIELFFTVAIGDERDLRAVGRPARPAVVRVRRMREVARRAFLDRHAEHVAARDDQRALGLGTEREVFDPVAGRDARRPHRDAVVRHLNRDLLVRVRLRVVDRELAVLLVHDLAVLALARPAHVPGLAGRQLLDLLRLDVVGVQVERAVAVGVEVDLVSDPHRVALGPRGRRDGFELGGLQVVDEEILRPTAFVALPRAEVARQRRVHDLRSARREVAAARDRHRQRDRQTAVEIDRVQVRVGQRPTVAHRAEQHRLAVVGPTVHLVVVAPAIRQRTARRIPRQLFRHAAGRRNHVHLLVAVVLAGERDPRAVGRKLREQLEPVVRGQARRGTAVRRREPQIARIAEDDFVAVDVGEAQELRLRVGSVVHGKEADGYGAQELGGRAKHD